VLRVYEPLDAFAAGQRRILAAVAADPDAGRAAEGAERVASWRCLLMPPERVDADPGVVGVGSKLGAEAGSREARTLGPAQARVLRVEGTTLLAPVVIGSSAPGLVERGHTLVRAWEIPLVWLALVRSENLTRSGDAGRYLVPMSRSRARTARALRALRSALGEVDVAIEVEKLARWLEQFHPRSWVELDARPVAALVDGEDGAEDVRLGLESLTVGDATSLAAAYRRVSRRSHRLKQLSVSS
jgi:hypothetical protein